MLDVWLGHLAQNNHNYTEVKVMKRLIATAAVCGLSLFGSTAVSYSRVSPPEINGFAPLVTGSTVQGSTLSTTNGTWTNNPTSYSYQWQRCPDPYGTTESWLCSNISGATSSTYVTQTADVGDAVQALVTATNAGGSSSFPSNAVGPITSATAVYYTGYQCHTRNGQYYRFNLSYTQMRMLVLTGWICN